MHCILTFTDEETIAGTTGWQDGSNYNFSLTRT